jgi:hypothetical protein
MKTLGRKKPCRELASGSKIGGECALYMMLKRWKCLPDRAFSKAFWQMSKP